MANYQLLKADIDAKVYENAQQKITGENLNSVLNQMVTTLGAEYQFAGVATIDTNPEITDAKVFYIANGKGTYTNFGGLEVTEDEVVVLYWDSSWHKVATGIASQAKLSELEKKIGFTSYTLNQISASYTESLFLEIKKGDVFNVVYKGTSSIRKVEYYYNDLWTAEDFLVSPVTSPSSDASPQILIASKDATRIRFYLYGENGVITLTNYGVRQELDEEIKRAINTDNEHTLEIADLKESMSFVEEYGINGMSKKATGDPSTFITIECPIIKGRTYYIKNEGNGVLKSLSAFNGTSWVSLTGNDLNDGNTIIYDAQFDATSVRAYVSTQQTTMSIYSVASIKGDAGKRLNDLECINGLSLIDTPISSTLFTSKPEFVSKMNTIFDSYAILCKSARECFSTLSNSMTWSQIFNTINHNFRRDVVIEGMSNERMAKEINLALAEPINRFSDAILNNGENRHFSLSPDIQADEPSVTISDDGGTMYIFAHLKRWSTNDGVNWGNPTPLVLNGGASYIMHCNVNYIDGVYYLIGCDTTVGGPIRLYTSTDGINFTHKGILFNSGHIVEQGITVESWGNVALMKEYGSGKFYLYYEFSCPTRTQGWEIALAISNNPTNDNGDGTCGTWEEKGVVITGYPSASWCPRGNMDFVKGSDNQPIKHNGRYYAYWHGSNNGSYSRIYRGYSTDLVHWTEEGDILNNRDIPTAGISASGNADHCVIEFKGKSYLIYTWDINDANVDPYIRIMIDSRPFSDLLKMRP